MYRVRRAANIPIPPEANLETNMNDLFFLVALVTMLQGGQEVGKATGFFYSKDNTTYFVTNRHVVINEEEGLKADALKLRLHAHAKDLTKNVDRIIPLYQGDRPRWHVHKDYSKVPIDIAVIEVEPKLLSGTSRTFLNNKSLYSKDRTAFIPGEDIVVIGFPRGLSDTTHNLALMRNALISSAYGINFRGQPVFLIDGNLHKGMSGSPVMTKPRTLIPSRTGFTIAHEPVTAFLGVFSATLSAVIPVKQKKEAAEKKNERLKNEEMATQEEALGLGIVWYGDLIEEIIENIRR
jgi:S1-C subfamily serine protease